MHVKVVNFHFLPSVSSLSYPAYTGPCAFHGDEGLEEGGLEEYLPPLVADSLNAHCFQDVDVHACGDACDADVAAEPQLFFPQRAKIHFYRSLHL